MAKADKKNKKPAQSRVGRQLLGGTPQTAKFSKNLKGINEVDKERLPADALAGDTVSFKNDLKFAVAIVLHEPTIGLVNLADGSPAGVEIAPDFRAIVLGKGDTAGPFGTKAPKSTDVKIFYMVIVDQKDDGGNIGADWKKLSGQDPEIIISG